MERLYYLAFSYLFEFIGPIRFKKLLEEFGTAEVAWSRLREKQTLTAIGIREIGIAKIDSLVKNLDFKTLEKILVNPDVTVLCSFEDTFPANLRELPNCPIVLYVRGQLPDTVSKSLAIVGTRKITSYGERVISTFIPTLVASNLTIVSGLAFGVDAFVAQTVLDNGGITVAVLASGVDKVTPRSNEQLGERIIANGGAIISELPLGTEPKDYYFPIRNRIIAGMSLGTLVIEAAEKSGSLHTINFASEAGRHIMAVPGSIFSEVSQGVNRLIKDGAGMVMSGEDVLIELGIVGATHGSPEFAGGSRPAPTGLNDTEKSIFEVVCHEPTHVDDLIRQLDLPTSVVNSTLTMLEIKGVIKNWGGGTWGV